MYNKLKILMSVLLLVIFGLVQYFALLPAVNNIIYDNIMMSSRAASDNIIIVGIDERSINEIGSWPWPRYFMAEAIMLLTEMEAAVIGINVLYDTMGAVPEYDEALLNAAQGTDRLVLGGMGILSPFQDIDGLLEIEHYVLPFGELGETATVGFLNAIPDESDGVMRRSVTSMRYGDITVHSFPFEVYRTYRRVLGQYGDIHVPLDSSGQLPIRYVGGPQSFTTVSFWGVINEHYPSAMFRNAIVLIGPYAQGIGEGNFTTPMERGIATHGVELYANVIQNFKEGIFVVDAPWWINLSILAFCGLIVILFLTWLKPLMAFLITVILSAALIVGARVAYDQFYMILSVSDTLLFLAAGYLVTLILGIFAAQNDRQQIKELFGRFVAPEVVNEIIAGGVDIQLGGIVKEVTALFVDIRGFTTFSEANTPVRVVNMVNRYLELTCTAIRQHSGTIDKFIGDATMALFNAPNNVPNHALCAVKAAWAMKQGASALASEIFNDYGVDLQFGIGINTGSAVVGNMGSDFRMDYTAIGDAINTAARLEASAEKGQIIISDATYQQVKDYVEVTELGTVSLKNKSVGVLIYNVENVRE